MNNTQAYTDEQFDRDIRMAKVCLTTVCGYREVAYKPKGYFTDPTRYGHHFVRIADNGTEQSLFLNEGTLPQIKHIWRDVWESFDVGVRS